MNDEKRMGLCPLSINQDIVSEKHVENTKLLVLFVLLDS